jgi:WD40 repeat protein
MVDVFISYSRADKPFVQRLHSALQSRQREVWIDWEDIEYAEDWWQKICAGIESADAFVFIITPNSARSKVCFDEVEHAVKYNKRIIPVLHIDVTDPADKARMHPAVNRHNWLPFGVDDDFVTNFDTLLKTISTDPEHVREHTRLLVRAKEWQDRGRPASLLLRGVDLKNAESWLANGISVQPAITDLHSAYIAASRKAERERTQVQFGVVAAALAVTSVLAVVALLFARQAEERRILADDNAATAVYNSGVAVSIALAAQAGLEVQGPVPERGVLLALKALEEYPYTWQAEFALTNALQVSRVRHIIKAHEKAIFGAVWSPDGSKFVTTSLDATAKIWDATTFELLFTLEGHADGVVRAAWSPDSTRIVTVSNDTTAKLWDASTGKPVLTFSGHTDRIRWVDWSPSGDLIATASYDGTAKIWRADDGTVTQTFPTAFSLVTFVDWSPTSEFLLIGDDSGTARVMNAATGDEVTVFSAPPSDIYITGEWSPDGMNILFGTRSGVVQHVSAIGESLASFNQHTFGIESAVWSPDGTRAATASDDGSIIVWDMARNIATHTLYGHSGAVGSVSWSPDGNMLVSGDIDGMVRLWNVQQDNAFLRIPTPIFGARALAWSPDGAMLAVLDDSLNISVWDLAAGMINRQFVTDSMGIIYWSSGGEQIILVSDRATVYDLQTGDVVRSLDVPQMDVWSALPSPDGNALASLDLDGVLRVWDGQTFSLRVAFPADDPVHDMVWSPDSTHIGTAHRGGVIRIWDVAAGSMLREFSSPAEVGGMAWSPDGTRIVTVNNDDSIRIWDTFTGQLTALASGHNHSYNAITWSSNSNRIAAGDNDGVIRIWDAGTGNQVAQIQGFDLYISHLAWSPTHAQIAASSALETVKVWNVWESTEALIADAYSCCVVRTLTEDEIRRFTVVFR